MYLNCIKNGFNFFMQHKNRNNHVTHQYKSTSAQYGMHNRPIDVMLAIALQAKHTNSSLAVSLL